MQPIYDVVVRFSHRTRDIAQAQHEVFRLGALFKEHDLTSYVLSFDVMLGYVRIQFSNEAEAARFKLAVDMPVMSYPEYIEKYNAYMAARIEAARPPRLRDLPREFWGALKDIGGWIKAKFACA